MQHMHRPNSPLTCRGLTTLMLLFTASTIACQSEDSDSGPADVATQPKALESAAEASATDAPAVTPPRSEEIVGERPSEFMGKASLLRGFDLHEDHASATVLRLGLDARIAHEGGVSFWTSPSYHTATHTYHAAEQVYALSRPTVRRSKGDAELSPARQHSLKGQRVTLSYADGVTEHYDHLTQGLEQTIEVARLPEGQGPLVVSYHVTTDWRQRLSEDGQRVEVYDPERELPVFTWTKLVAFDAEGDALEARMDVRGERLAYVVEGVEDAALPITIDPLASMPDASIEGDTSGVNYGESMRMTGDINGDGFDDIVIGQPLFTGAAGALSGRFLVYAGRSGAVTNTADFSAEGSQGGEFMGFRVSILPDVDDDGRDDVVVTSPLYDFDSATSDSGKVYLFQGDTTLTNLKEAWTYESQLADERLGFTLNESGDFNCDGHADLAAGAYLANSGRGTLKVFYGEPASMADPQLGGFPPSPGWTLSGQAASSNLSTSLSNTGNPTGITNNGIACDGLAVGSSGFTAPGRIAAGRVQVFLGSPTGLDQSKVPDWDRTGAARQTFLGVAVASGKDLNGDTIPDLAIGSLEADTSGRVEVFYGSPTDTFSMSPDWTEDRTSGDAYFGEQLHLIDDLNGDVARGFATPIADLLVGSPRYSDNQTNEGRVELFFGSENGIADTAAWSVTGGDASVRLGIGLSSGDFDNDGFADVAVSGTGFDQTAQPQLANVGRVDVYYGGQTCLFNEIFLVDGEIDPDDNCKQCDTTNPGTPVPVNDGQVCDDGTLCTINSVCSAGACVPATVNDTVDCSSLDDACNDGVCDPATGTCNAEPKADGTSCPGDGLSCTVDVCQAGACDSSQVDPTTCLINGTCYSDGDGDPANPCDQCDPSADQTAFTAAPDGTTCNDGDACTAMETCQSGVCTASGTTDCDDGDACTSDSCDPVTGCANIPIQLDCTNLDTTCTAGACDPATGSCTAVPTNEGGACDDGNLCTTGDSCSSGTCVGSMAVDCSDSNPCTTDLCDPATGCSNPPVQQGVGCDEMDALACTSGVCDGAGSCSVVVTTGCAINGTCYMDGATNPNNPCQVCDASQSRTMWSAKMAGTVCIEAGCLQDGRYQPEATCDGAGMCSNTPPNNCGLYTCDMGCKTMCTQDSDCIMPGAFCNTDASECVSDGTNLAPNADAGPDQAVEAGAMVSLDASGSSDPNAADTLSYEWAFVSSTTDTQVGVTDAMQAQASAEIPREPLGSEYTFEVTATDDGMPSLSDTDVVVVVIDSVPNDAPEAVISGPDEAEAGETIELDASGSSDPDGDDITGYEWRLIGPLDPAPTLTGVDEELLEITFPDELTESTAYTFELNVVDEFGTSSRTPASQTILVTVPESEMGMEVEPDMGDMGDMGDMSDMEMSDMGADMEPTDSDPEGDIQGSSCFCASVDHDRDAPPAELWLLAIGGLLLARRRRRA